MRSDQIYGLNVRGRKIADGKDIRVKVTIVREYLDGGYPPETEVKEILEPENISVESGETYSGFNDYPLHRYLAPDGTEVCVEAVQEVIWSSGPMIFLALKNENGAWINESLWTDKELRDAR